MMLEINFSAGDDGHCTMEEAIDIDVLLNRRIIQ